VEDAVLEVLEHEVGVGRHGHLQLLAQLLALLREPILWISFGRNFRDWVKLRIINFIVLANAYIGRYM
jgi:hypothetical protein